jgi:nitrite transporter NirC
LADQGDIAAGKVADLRRPGRYLVSSMLAGSYIGVAVVLMSAVAGPLLAATSPWTKLIEGSIFGVALTLCVFAGAELSTGNMMTSVLGLFTRRISVGGAVGLILGSFVGNLIGSIVFSWIVEVSGVLTAGAEPGKVAPALALVTSLVKAKTAESVSALFFRGVLCNFLVCLAVWAASRTKSDGAKLALIWWCLLAFVASGFEHVVANMTTFSLGMMAGVKGATLAAFAKNLLFVGLGNLVGGGLLVGAAYGFLARSKGVVDEVEPDAPVVAAASAVDAPQQSDAFDKAEAEAVAEEHPAEEDEKVESSKS